MSSRSESKAGDLCTRSFRISILAAGLMYPYFSDLHTSDSIIKHALYLSPPRTFSMYLTSLAMLLVALWNTYRVFFRASHSWCCHSANPTARVTASLSGSARVGTNMLLMYADHASALALGEVMMNNYTHSGSKLPTIEDPSQQYTAGK